MIVDPERQHYVQANFTLVGWITIAHIPDTDVAAMTSDEILDATWNVPWIREMATSNIDYGDMIELRLISESINIHRTRAVNKDET